jgi:hypothetical protein
MGRGSTSGARAARIGAATLANGAGCTMYGTSSTGVGHGTVAIPPSAPPPVRIPPTGQPVPGVMPPGALSPGVIPPGAGAAGGSGTDCPGRSGLIACSTVWVVEAIVWAMLVELDWLDWMTSPSSPGLRIRIEIDVLQAEQVGVEPWDDEVEGGATVGQSQVQFQIQSVAPGGGADGDKGLSAQFHDQFQIQVSGSDIAWSSEMPSLG